MREITYVKAFTESLMQLMAEDDDVVVIGEDVAHYGGVFHAFDGLWKTYGERRVIDTPISEMGFIGMGVGAAARGLRPVCDLMFFDFIGVCLDQLYNQAAKLKFMFGGDVSVPLTLTTAGGAGLSAGPQHSQSLEAWLAHVPGLKVALPSSPHDVKGLMVAAVRDDNPTVVILNKRMLGTKGPVPEEIYEIPFGHANVMRSGTRRDDHRRRPHGPRGDDRGGVARGGRHRGRGHRRAHRPAARQRDDPRLGAPNEPGARGPRGGHLRRDRSRDLFADPGRGIRLPRRTGAAHRRAVLAGPVQPGPRAGLHPGQQPDRGRSSSPARALGGLTWRSRCCLPKLGLTMETGLIEEWLVTAGTLVQPGEPLMRLATDKVEVDVEAEAEGLFHPAVAQGSELPPGALVGWLLAEGEAVPATAAAAPAAPTAAPQARRDRWSPLSPAR